MTYIKDISLFLIISTIINSLSHLLGTEIVMTFLKSNIITIQLTLMAINTATSGLVVSKLQDLKDKHKNIDITPILKSLKSAFKEQIFLIAFAVLFVILLDTTIFNNLKFCEQIKFIVEVFLIAVFVNSIQILWDTGKSIFVIIEVSDNSNESQN